MKKLIPYLLGLVTIMIPLLSADSIAGQRRRVVARPGRVVVRRPVARTRLVVRTGHPLRRTLPASVVVRPARRSVVVNKPLVYLPAHAWTRTVVALPARERLAWQDTETIEREEEWVDTNFGIDASGNALFLDIDGRAKLNFAEVIFANGNVQVVDFNDQTHNTGVYQLLDFADGRHVSTVRLIAKSESDETKLTVYLGRG